MSAPLLERAGRWRALEGTIEVTVPVASAVFAWALVSRLGGAPVPSRGLSPWELGALIGAALALTGWAVSRLLYLMRRRHPALHVGLAMGLGALLLMVMPSRVRASFAARCDEALGGTLIALEAWPDGSGEGRLACQVRGQPGSVALTGALWRPGWDGRLLPSHLLLFAIASASGALALRDRRVMRSRVGLRMSEALRLAPAAGLESCFGKGADPARITACGNPTLWGEPCGQLYPATRVWEPGEPCVRCRQAFQPCRRTVPFRVVSLISADVEVLNGEERVASAAWDRGQNRAPRPSTAQARWVELGVLRLPDVLSVSQALALAHAALEGWAESEKPDVREAAGLARQRASRVSCWMWFGALDSLLHRARPGRFARLAVGPARLRDLLSGVGPCWLQLDVGLLPLELRLGHRLNDANGNLVQVQDEETVLWIPVSPPARAGAAPGVWVPRVEGEALRAWLSTERFVSPEAKGRMVPVPYHISEPDSPPPDLKASAVGELSFVLRPVRTDRDEPVHETAPGASLSEWRWLEAEQIELLRQQALVLVGAQGRS